MEAGGGAFNLGVASSPQEGRRKKTRRAGRKRKAGLGFRGGPDMGRAEHRYSLVLATLAGLRGDDASVGKDEAKRALLACDFDDAEIEAYFEQMESENRVMILEGTVHIHSLD